MLESMTGNGVISDVVAMSVVLSRAEKHVPYWELVRSRESVTL